MQVSSHWNAAASDVARRLGSALAGLDVEGPLVLNVRPTEEQSAFNRAFYNLLATELMQQGFGVTLDPAEADLDVFYDVQAVTSDAIPGGTVRGVIPVSEVIISTSVMHGNRFVTRISDIYYINNFSTDQYVSCCNTPARIIEVVGP